VLDKSANGKNFYDIALNLYDKNPILTGSVIVIIAITPIVVAWFSYLKKKEDTRLEKFKYIRERRGKVR
jgi:hypothetical protein